VIVPILLNLTNPHSVIDIGCGTGAWLSVIKKLGITKILGIDGDYIENSSLLIDQNEFFPTDLTQPFYLSETFDLALCLEVAEHLPVQRAQEFVSSLARLSPLIFFSAAVPGQYAPHHINLQWPEYWEKLFADIGYLMLDPIRPLIWQDQRCRGYYPKPFYARKSMLKLMSQYCNYQNIKLQMICLNQ
jgi:SAM-dependent methyltransferase